MRACAVDGCDATHYAKGFCRAHHANWRRYGDPMAFPPSALVFGGLDEREARMCAWVARHAWASDGSYIRGWEKAVGQHPPPNFDWRSQVSGQGFVRGVADVERGAA